jgi:hypothetical protein
MSMHICQANASLLHVVTFANEASVPTDSYCYAKSLSDSIYVAVGVHVVNSTRLVAMYTAHHATTID